jgi:hypothetical protein
MIVGVIFVILLTSNIISVILASDMRQVVMSDNAGPKTSDYMFDLSIISSNGRNLRYELTASADQSVDVYLMSLNQFDNMKANQSFQYLDGSAFGISHVKIDSYLEGNQTNYVLVAFSSPSDPSGTQVPISWTVQQSQYPLVYHDIFSILVLPLVFLNLLVFFYLVKAYSGFSACRRSQRR